MFQSRVGRMAREIGIHDKVGECCSRFSPKSHCLLEYALGNMATCIICRFKCTGKIQLFGLKILGEVWDYYVLQLSCAALVFESGWFLSNLFFVLSTSFVVMICNFILGLTSLRFLLSLCSIYTPCVPWMHFY